MESVLWRFYVGDRQKEVAFFKDVLGMKVLRHEEFAEEIDRSTSLRTSKTLVGYGGEGYFIFELHFTYGAPEFKTGNAFLGVTIVSKTAIARAKALNWPIVEIGDKLFRVESPQGFTCHLMNLPTPTECDPVAEICLLSSYMIATLIYWQSTFGAQALSVEDEQVTFSFGEEKCKIRFVSWYEEIIEEGSKRGHLVLSMPRNRLEHLEYRSLESNRKHTARHAIVEPGYSSPCESLEFRDHDNYQVFIVEEEGFGPLIAVDPDAQNAFDLSLQREQRRNEHFQQPSSASIVKKKVNLL